MGARGKRREKGYSLKWCNGQTKPPYLYIWGSYNNEKTSTKRKNKSVSHGTSYYDGWVSFGNINGAVAQNFLAMLQEENERVQKEKIEILESMLQDKYPGLKLDPFDYSSSFLASDINKALRLVDERIQRQQEEEAQEAKK
jgi:hypothetical protein